MFSLIFMLDIKIAIMYIIYITYVCMRNEKEI
jgi:hypothetical protein